MWQKVWGCGRSVWLWQKYLDVAKVCSDLMDVPRDVDEEPQRQSLAPPATSASTRHTAIFIYHSCLLNIIGSSLITPHGQHTNMYAMHTTVMDPHSQWLHTSLPQWSSECRRPAAEPTRRSQIAERPGPEKGLISTTDWGDIQRKEKKREDWW